MRLYTPQKLTLKMWDFLTFPRQNVECVGGKKNLKRRHQLNLKQSYK